MHEALNCAVWREVHWRNSSNLAKNLTHARIVARLSTICAHFFKGSFIYMLEGGVILKKHVDDDVAMVAQICSLKSASIITPDLWRCACECRLSSVLQKRLRQLFWVVARITQNSKLVLADLPIQQGDILGVNADEVLSVANTRPTAIVHVTSDFATSHLVQIQSIPCPIHRGNW